MTSSPEVVAIAAYDSIGDENLLKNLEGKDLSPIPTPIQMKGKGAGKPLAIMKRSMPTPGVGHYDDVPGLYIKMTQPKAKGLTALSMDKIPKIGFVPPTLAPEASIDADDLQNKQDFFKYS